MLTRTECSALRGLAIIGIFLHNYCHWLGFAVKENEYTFTIAKSSQLIKAISSPDSNLFIHLVSFFGHYGVPIFLFLSAYGLVMKYENKGSGKPMPPATGGSGKSASSSTALLPFIAHHYKKLFKMMIVGFVCFVMVDAITPGAHHYQVLDIVAQMLMFNNVLPDPDHIIWPGPYWFFGLMMQLYIVYRLLLWRRADIIPLLLIVACWAMQAFCDPEGDTLNRVRYNCMGGMLPFCAGLLFARRFRSTPTHAFWVTQTIISVVLVFFFSFNFQLWLWAPLFVCSAAVGLAKIMPHKVNVCLAWMGNISSALFVLHPIIRKIFIPISRHGDVYTGLLLYVIVCVAVARFYKKF